MELHQIEQRLASQQGTKDTEANVVLAETLVKNGDGESIRHLAELLRNGKAPIKSDAIKVLYEIGKVAPERIQDHLKVFLDLLQSKNNRLQWGSLTAIAAISKVVPEKVFPYSSKIMEVAESGSVITRDQAVAVFTTLSATPKYQVDAFQWLMKLLLKSPVNQLPMYAENVLPIVPKDSMNTFRVLLEVRLEEIAQESKRKRILRVLKNL